MPTLSYSGRLSIATNDDGTIPVTEQDKLDALLEDSINSYESIDIVMRSFVVHFEREDSIDSTDMPRTHVDLEASGELAELETLETTLAQEVVSMGMEETITDAKEEIGVER